jgi:CDGSH-type Zn-finger protein
MSIFNRLFGRPAPPPPAKIVYRKRGTIVLEGEATILDEDGNVIPPRPGKKPGIVKLCGCGRSREKPYCDGSHKLEVRSEK